MFKKCIGIFLIVALSGCMQPATYRVRPAETALLTNKIWRLTSKNYKFESLSYRYEGDEIIPVYKSKTITYDGKTYVEQPSGEGEGHLEERTQEETVIVDGVPQTRTVKVTSYVGGDTPVVKDSYVEEVFFTPDRYSEGAYEAASGCAPLWNQFNETWGWVDSSERLISWHPRDIPTTNNFFEVRTLTDTEFSLAFQDVINKGYGAYEKYFVELSYVAVERGHCESEASPAPPPPPTQTVSPEKNAKAPTQGAVVNLPLCGPFGTTKNYSVTTYCKLKSKRGNSDEKPTYSTDVAIGAGIMTIKNFENSGKELITLLNTTTCKIPATEATQLNGASIEVTEGSFQKSQPRIILSYTVNTELGCFAEFYEN